MGPRNDSNAVVDSRGRVYGVKGLRIVDASIFPLLPPGHPQGTVCESFLGSEGKLVELTRWGADGLAEKIASEILTG